MDVVVKTHVGAYGIMIQNKKIALVKKARGGYKGKLDLPGGGIEHTELPCETLKRELMEEAGVIIKNYKLLDTTATNIKWQIKEDLWEDLHHIGILYLVEIEGSSLKSEADGLDSEGCCWYNIKDLDVCNLSPFAKYALNVLEYISE